jgi:phosphoesterase RecJ-like protein
MELSPKQQISELIKQSQRILVVSHKNAGGDAVGSMLALERVLTKAGKEVTIVLSEKIEENLTFLPGIEKIKHDVEGARDLTIRIKKDKFPIDKLTYNEEDGYLNIVLTPKGVLDQNNLEFVQGEFKFDLIFVLDTPDVEKIDAIYDRYTELFFETPILNIDHHSGNEYFGTVNMVDLTATSTAEILVSIIEAMGPGNFDADVSTCLLTGIIADTASFKNTNTTPKSLTISAQMLAAGARQQEVIQNLYKTRPLSTLKLWGRLLSNMEYDQAHRMVTSTITLADFTETGGNTEEIHGVMDELLAKAPGTDVVLLLAETAKGKLTGKLKGMNGSDVLVIAEAFGGTGHVLAAGFDIANATLADNKAEVMAKVIAIRDKQLGRGASAAAEVSVVPASNVIRAKAGIQAPDSSSTKGGQATVSNNNAETMKQNVEVVKKHEQVVVPVPSTPSPVIPTNTHVISTEAEKSTPGRSLDYARDDNGVSAEELASLDALVELEIQNSELETPQEPGYSDIFTPIAVTTAKEDEITQAIKSIDDEIEGVTEETPNIDVEDNKDKKAALRQIGEVIRGYNPGKPLEEKGEQPVDPTIWK